MVWVESTEPYREVLRRPMTAEERQGSFLDEKPRSVSPGDDDVIDVNSEESAVHDTEPRRATITISETPKENTLSIDVEFFPELNLQDDAFSGLAHLVCTALEAINKEAERHVG